jgi:hypothetical protein
MSSMSQPNFFSREPKHCPACQMEIEEYSSRCPHCTSDIYWYESDKNDGSIGGFIGSLMIGGLVGGFIGETIFATVASAAVLGAGYGLMWLIHRKHTVPSLSPDGVA